MHVSYFDLATSLRVLYFLLPLLDPLTAAVAELNQNGTTTCLVCPEKRAQ
jgi:hypothetical protein